MKSSRPNLCFSLALALQAFCMAWAADLEWYIIPKASKVYSAFSEGSVDQLVDFEYEIPFLYAGKSCGVSLFAYDCQSEAPAGALSSSLDLSVAEKLTATARVHMGVVTETELYDDLPDYKGQVEFCVRIDCSLEGYGSVTFHETQVTLGIDRLAGFTTTAEAKKDSDDPFSIYKELQSYTMTLYPVEEIFDPQNLALLFLASARWLGAETNARVAAEGINNPHDIIIEAINQRLVEISLRRKLLQEQLQKQYNQAKRLREARSLQEGPTPGVEIDVEVNALFEQYPAPATETMNAHIRDTVDDPDAAANFMGNLSLAILEADLFCESPLALITNAEFEYEKNITLTNLYTGETSVVESETGSTGSSYNLTLEDIANYESYIDACGGNQTFPNITGPGFEPNDPQRDEVDFSITIQETAYAYFCNDENLEVPAPTVSQGDTLQVCVTMQDSDYFHVEDTFTFVLAQSNTTAEPFIPILENEIQAPQIFVYGCELGICNHLMQVPSRFFDDPQPLQISGVAILNFGEADRRVLSRKLQEEISDRQRNSPSYFQLQAFLGVEKGSRYGTISEAPSWVWIAVGSGVVITLACAAVTIVIVRRRSNEKTEESSSSSTASSKGHPVD